MLPDLLSAAHHELGHAHKARLRGYIWHQGSSNFLDTPFSHVYGLFWLKPNFKTEEVPEVAPALTELPGLALPPWRALEGHGVFSEE